MSKQRELVRFTTILVVSLQLALAPSLSYSSTKGKKTEEDKFTNKIGDYPIVIQDTNQVRLADGSNRTAKITAQGRTPKP